MKKEKTKSSNISADQKIPIPEAIAYGSAEIYGGGSATLISLVLLFYLNVILGIDAAIAGTIILVSKAWDAISDPLMGVISDNTRSKFGRRKIYMMIGSGMTFLAMLLLFAPIKDLEYGAKIAIATIAYIFFCTSNTVSQVPFCSLSADISGSHKERNKANTIKLIFSMVGAALCFLIPSIVIDGQRKEVGGEVAINPDAQWKIFLLIGVVFAFVFAIPLFISGFFTKERAYYNPNKKTKFSFRSYLTPFKVKSYKWHLLMYISAFLCMDLISAILFYYTYLIADKAPKPVGAKYIVGPMMVMAALLIPLVLIIAKKKSKQFAYRLGLPLYVLGGVLLASYQTNWPWYLIPVFAVIMGVGIAGAQSMPWMIFPDTVDAAALKLRTKPTGTFSGLMTFSRKMTQAVAIFMVGIVFQTIGITSDAKTGKIKFSESLGSNTVLAEEKAVRVIRTLIIVIVVTLILIAFISSTMYKLNSKKLDRIKYFLDKQKGRADDNNLTEEEMKEKAELIRKYC